MNRRGFLASILAAGAAPAIVRAASLMPIKAPPVWVPNHLLRAELEIYNDIRIIAGPRSLAASLAARMWAEKVVEECYETAFFQHSQWAPDLLRRLK